MFQIVRSQWRPSGQGCRQQAGFTLIELMVTISIASILMFVAVPSFVQFQRNAKLSEAVSAFISAANAARANAMKLGLNTYLVPNGANWSTGWFVFTDKNWNQTFDAGTDEVVLSHEALSSDITIATVGASSLTNGYLLFNGSGYPRLKDGGFGGGTIVMSNISPRSSSIIINPSGRVRSCKTDSTGCSD